MTLLPSNASALERALDLGDERLAALPVDLVRAAQDPRTCPAAMLGFLAWQLSIDLWDDAWPELKKRQVCAAAFALHRRKTTLAGIRDHVALVDSTVLRAVRPRDRRWQRATPTAADREARLAKLPQIRVYPFADAAVAPNRAFYRGASRRAARVTIDGDAFDMSSTVPTIDVAAYADLVDAGRLPTSRFQRAGRGAQLLGRRVRLVDAAGDRAIEFLQAVDGTLRFAIPSRGRSDWRGRSFYGHSHLVAADAATRVVAVRLDPAALAFAVAPGADAVAVAPVRVFERTTAQSNRAYYGRPARGRFQRTSRAPLLVYDRISLADGTGDRARAFYDGRHSVPAFTAELTIDVPMRRARRRAGRWNGVGFVGAASMAPLARTIEAVRVAKAHRDTILVDPTAWREVRFGDGLAFGDFTFGQLRKVA